MPARRKRKPAADDSDGEDGDDVVQVPTQAERRVRPAGVSATSLLEGALANVPR